MAYPNYQILIRRCNNHNVSYIEISEFQQLSILDKLNDLGTWSISSVSKERPDFLPADGIIVKRNGIIIYSGVVLKVEATYEIKINGWRWKASGSNDLTYMKWALIYPYFEDSWETEFSQRYLTYSPGALYGTYCEAIWSLITFGLQKGNKLHGFEIVGQPDYPESETRTPLASDVVLRFDNMLETVQLLAQYGELAVIPRWSESSDKIIYYITRGADHTQDIVFDMDNGTLESVKYTFQAPEYTIVSYGYNSDKVPGYGENEEMWRWLKEENLSPVSSNTHGFSADGDWESGNWEQRFTFRTPSKEDLWSIKDKYFPEKGTPYQYDVLYKYADVDSGKIKKYNDTSYEVSIVLHDHPIWKRDFDMGDKVLIQLPDGTQIRDKVAGIQIDFSYGTESMKVALSSMASGTFSPMNRDVEDVKKQFAKAQLSEVDNYEEGEEI